jgi:transposase, IS30 family
MMDQDAVRQGRPSEGSLYGYGWAHGRSRHQAIGRFQRSLQHPSEGVVMAGRDKPGREPLHEQRAQFAGLIALGFSDAEASRRAGINPETGWRWLGGRVVIAPDGRRREYGPVVINTPREISARFLSAAERIVIADLRRAGRTVRQIGAELGRSPPTISRELRRNRHAPTGTYRPHHADQLAAVRRRRPGRGRLLRDCHLRAVVEALLGQRLSPEQISHHLKDRFPTERVRQLCAESIYQAVYRTELGGLRRLLPRTLRTGRLHRRRRVRADQRRGRLMGMVSIADRPADHADRTIPGVWEGDLILGAGNWSAIATLVERTTRTTLLLHLGTDRSAENLRTKIIAALSAFPPGLRRSLTWDRGKEMAQHARITQSLQMPVYFCNPGSPWQRPSNENTNGVLRHFFPKGTDLAGYSPDDLDAVARQLNNRPRKVLDWATPAVLLHDALPAPVEGDIKNQIQLLL